MISFNDLLTDHSTVAAEVVSIAVAVGSTIGYYFYGYIGLFVVSIIFAVGSILALLTMIDTHEYKPIKSIRTAVHPVPTQTRMEDDTHPVPPSQIESTEHSGPPSQRTTAVPVAPNHTTSVGTVYVPGIDPEIDAAVAWAPYDPSPRHMIPVPTKYKYVEDPVSRPMSGHEAAKQLAMLGKIAAAQIM